MLIKTTMTTNNKKALLLISGISEVEYCLTDLQAHRIFPKLKNTFQKIEEFKYQYVLDELTLNNRISRVYLDPARLKIDGLKKAIIKKMLQLHIELLKREGYDVYLFCHSLGTWIAAMTNVKVSGAWFAGSPIGWFAPLGRFIVRNDISFWPNQKCPLKVENTFYNLFSKKDKVGNVSILSANKKWGFGAQYKYEYETNTEHDFTQYLDWILHNLSWSILNA